MTKLVLCAVILMTTLANGVRMVKMRRHKNGARGLADKTTAEQDSSDVKTNITALGKAVTALACRKRGVECGYFLKRRRCCEPSLYSCRDDLLDPEKKTCQAFNTTFLA